MAMKQSGPATLKVAIEVPQQMAEWFEQVSQLSGLPLEEQVMSALDRYQMHVQSARYARQNGYDYNIGRW